MIAAVETLRRHPFAKGARELVDAASLRLAAASREKLREWLVERSGRYGVWEKHIPRIEEALNGRPSDLAATLELLRAAGGLWSSQSRARRLDDWVTLGTVGISGAAVAQQLARHGLHLDLITALYTTAATSSALVGIESAARLLSRPFNVLDVDDRRAIRFLTTALRLNSLAYASMLAAEDLPAFVEHPSLLGAARLIADATLSSGAVWGLRDEVNRIRTGRSPKHPYWPTALIGVAGVAAVLLRLLEEDSPAGKAPTSSTTTPSTTTAATQPSTTQPATTQPSTTQPVDPPDLTDDADAPAAVPSRVTAQPGDSFWSLARTHVDWLLGPEEQAALNETLGSLGVEREATLRLIAANGFDAALMDGVITPDASDPDGLPLGWQVNVNVLGSPQTAR